MFEFSEDSATAAPRCVDVRSAGRAARTAAALDAEFGGDRPRIVVLCGSARFSTSFRRRTTGFSPPAKAQDGHGEGVGPGSAEKVALDELHKRKIDLADEVHVLHVGGYIGASTRSEIDYAEAAGKPIAFMVPE